MDFALPILVGLEMIDWIIIGVVAVVVAIPATIILVNYLPIWFQAYMSGANISMFSLIGMSFRQVNSRVIVQAKIMAMQAGIGSERETGLSTQRLEAHYLAGGNVPGVIRAIIAAHRADIDLDFDRAAAIDLAGRNVLEAVQTCVNPKVIDVPQAPGSKVVAMAKDGIQVLARARVTVRTNISRLVGGATEETIIARVGEGIVTSIGSADNYKAVLENPDGISKRVLEKGLDSGTAFDILSIDIADVDVGTNVGAALQADQAEADKRRFQAEAENRAAMARAREAEMSALVEENRAEVVKAEALIPRAMADAFRSGNLGVMDYYKFRNIQADTSMRDSIGKGDEGETIT